MEPSIFLFDEPFANLDARAVDELEILISELRATQHTIIIEVIEPILSFEDVRYRYSRRSEEILHGISCQIYRGETIALLGPNGSGKTTLVKQALGLLRLTQGGGRGRYY